LDFDHLDVAHLTERIEIRAGHPAGANHPHGLAIRPRKILHAKPGAASHAYVLQDRIGIDRRSRNITPSLSECLELRSKRIDRRLALVSLLRPEADS
jgi:hypothetical protein